MDIFSIFSLLGGLAFFLYGMDFMGDSLKRLSGSQLETILGKLTATRFKGFLLGLIVTAVIQSSSATTVMLVGFVNSGIMKLSQTISIIMGANIGTTVTAWILSLNGISGENQFLRLLNPSSFTPIMAFIGFLLMLSRSDKRKNIGSILMGFAVLMFGMDVMTGAMEGLKNSDRFKEILLMFENPFLGILCGTLLTAIIQSSSASVGILQALSMTGTIPTVIALPIILGQNIGTTITPVISSFTGNTGAKRVAVSCVYIKLIGVVIISIIFYILHGIFDFGFMHTNASMISIAVIHTTFNVISTIVLIPFCKLIEKLAVKTIKDNSMQAADEFSALDARFFTLPQFAIDKSREILCAMTKISKDAFCMALDNARQYDKDRIKKIQEAENRVDIYEDKLGTYLVKLATQDMSEKDSNEVSKYLHIIGDVERISDHAVSIAKVSEEIHNKNMAFSEHAQQEINMMSDALREILNLTYMSLKNNDLELAKKIEPLEQIIDKIKHGMKKNHVRRLKEGRCTIEQGFVLNDFIADCERVADHCSNIGVCMLEIANHSFETHEYLNHVKVDGENDFFEEYNKYKQKYKID